MLAGRRQSSSAFPAAEIALDGWMERTRAGCSPPWRWKNRYRAVLRDNRGSRCCRQGARSNEPIVDDLSVSHAGEGHLLLRTPRPESRRRC